MAAPLGPPMLAEIVAGMGIGGVIVKVDRDASHQYRVMTSTGETATVSDLLLREHNMAGFGLGGGANTSWQQQGAAKSPNMDWLDKRVNEMRVRL